MIGLVLFGGVFLAGVACAVFWDTIKSTLQKIKKAVIDALKKIGVLLLETTLSLANAIITGIKKGVNFCMKVRQFFYNKKTKIWQEVVETQNIDASEIPEHILAKTMQHQETDISNDIRAELSLEY